jgi:hypothetical protein
LRLLFLTQVIDAQDAVLPWISSPLAVTSGSSTLPFAMMASTMACEYNWPLMVP